MSRLNHTKAALLKLADPGPSVRQDVWEQWDATKGHMVKACGWIGMCKCRILVAPSPWRWKCGACKTPMIDVPYQDGFVTAFVLGGWPAVQELATALYCELPRMEDL